MWEAHPAYQKAQAKMIGLLVLASFIGSVICCLSNRDWELLRSVLYAAVGLIVALAVLPLLAWGIVRAATRRPPSRRPSGSQKHHGA
jgi:hypothetical protein